MTIKPANCEVCFTNLHRAAHFKRYDCWLEGKFMILLFVLNKFLNKTGIVTFLMETYKRSNISKYMFRFYVYRKVSFIVRMNRLHNENTRNEKNDSLAKITFTLYQPRFRMLFHFLFSLNSARCVRMISKIFQYTRCLSSSSKKNTIKTTCQTDLFLFRQIWKNDRMRRAHF